MARVSFIKKAIASRLFLAIALMLVAVLGTGFGRQILRNRQIEEDIARLERQASDLAARNVQIGTLQQALQTESFLEREARLKLGMKKPGESVVVIQDQPMATPVFESLDDLAARGFTDPVPAASNPTRWWMYFFDRRAYQTLIDVDAVL